MCKECNKPKYRDDPHPIQLLLIPFIPATLLAFIICRFTRRRSYAV